MPVCAKCGKATDKLITMSLKGGPEGAPLCYKCFDKLPAEISKMAKKDKEVQPLTLPDPEGWGEIAEARAKVKELEVKEADAKERHKNAKEEREHAQGALNEMLDEAINPGLFNQPKEEAAK